MTERSWLGRCRQFAIEVGPTVLAVSFLVGTLTTLTNEMAALVAAIDHLVNVVTLALR
jgi:hypothetical protein